MQHVADDHHPLALDAAKPLPDGERVEQRLRGVFVGAVAGVDHGRTAILAGRPFGELLGGSGGGVPDDQRVGARGTQGQSGVAQRFPLDTDDPDALTLMTSALIHFPATSNDTRVRVEFS